MALEGTLKDFSLADIFQLIGLQRKTGVLTLRGKDDTVTVTFLDGKVVGADSLNRRLENRLGTVLMKSGMLSQEQLSRALEIQHETLQRRRDTRPRGRRWQDRRVAGQREAHPHVRSGLPEEEDDAGDRRGRRGRSRRD